MQLINKAKIKNAQTKLISIHNKSNKNFNLMQKKYNPIKFTKKEN